MSVLNNKYKFIYIHVPKTAGSSIESVGWMGTKTNQHDSILDYENLLKITKFSLNDYFKWTIIRNPYTRFLSAVFNHLKKETVINIKKLNELIKKNGHDLLKIKVFEPQVSFLKDSTGRINLDYIGVFEDLQGSFDKVCKQMGITPTELPHINKGSDLDYDFFVTDELIDFVRKYYWEDFELYNKVIREVVIDVDELKKARLEELLAKEADVSEGLGEDEARELRELKLEDEAVEAPVEEGNERGSAEPEAVEEAVEEPAEEEAEPVEEEPVEE